MKDKLTVREAFALAGHSVPEGGRLVAHFLMGAAGTASDVKRYWSWRCITQVAHFLNDEWQLDQINEDNPTDPIRVITAVSIDLSNLPAIDALDALPECVRKVVQP